jgi:hypothetical protein
MSKNYQIIIIFCICLVSFSVFYYFVIRPYQKNEPFRDCMIRIAKARSQWEDRTNKAFDEGKTDEEGWKKSMVNADVAYSQWKEDCYKKFK